MKAEISIAAICGVAILGFVIWISSAHPDVDELKAEEAVKDQKQTEQGNYKVHDIGHAGKVYEIRIDGCWYLKSRMYGQPMIHKANCDNHEDDQ